MNEGAADGCCVGMGAAVGRLVLVGAFVGSNVGALVGRSGGVPPPCLVGLHVSLPVGQISNRISIIVQGELGMGVGSYVGTGETVGERVGNGAVSIAL